MSEEQPEYRNTREALWVFDSNIAMPISPNLMLRGNMMNASGTCEKLADLSS